MWYQRAQKLRKLKQQELLKKKTKNLKKLSQYMLGFNLEFRKNLEIKKKRKEM